eukprot:6491302-Amphidinium_carterae.1
MAGEENESFEDASAAQGARTLDVKSSLPSVRLRSFNGEHAAYREWRREAEAAQLLYNIPPERMATLLFLSLEPGAGKPRDLLAHMSLSEIATESGLMQIWKTLDEEYVLPSYRKADKAASRYEYCKRQPSQPMSEYVMMMKIARKELEREDPVYTLRRVVRTALASTVRSAICSKLMSSAVYLLLVGQGGHPRKLKTRSS